MPKIFIVSVLLLALSMSSIACQKSQESSAYKFIQPENVNEMLSDKDFFLVDVHVPEQPHIIKTDAMIPYYDIKNRLGDLPNDKNAEIILYCLTNSMSIEAFVELESAGYTNVKILDGGTTRWRELGYEFE